MDTVYLLHKGAHFNIKGGGGQDEAGLGQYPKEKFFWGRCSLTHSHTIARTKYPLKTMREEENDRYMELWWWLETHLLYT